MTAAQLVVKNVFRNRRRTLLTAGSVAVSIFLLAVFCATYRYIDAPPEPGGWHLVLYVGPRTSLMIPLPLSYGERIAKLPGAVAVTPLTYFDARYGSDDTVLPAVAVEPGIISMIFAEWRLPQDQRQAFVNEKAALVAGRKVADKFGWKLGDHLTLRSPSYSVALDLVLRGIYSSEEEGLLTFHWDYLNDSLGHPNKPGGFWVLARTADDVPRLMKDIDAMFRNADVETRTQTAKQFVLDFLTMLGNVKLILLSISAAVVFAVLLIVANTMAMSIQERTSELAVLRTLGFRTSQVLGLLAAESLAISVTGAAVGCLAAWILFLLIRGYRIGGMLPTYIQVDVVTVGLALGVALGISLASTLIPAYRASRTSIAEALRYVG